MTSEPRKGRIVGTLRCPRGRHVIARARVEVVEVRTATVRREGVTWQWEWLPCSKFAEFAAASWPVSCPCGVLLSADLAALVRGEAPMVSADPVTLAPPGVSYDRNRRAVR